MNVDALVGLLVNTALCALLAFLAALLLRTRQSILAYIGAGLFGQALGMWIAGAVHGTAWPYTLTIATSSVHLLWTFLGALIVLLLFRYVPRGAK